MKHTEKFILLPYTEYKRMSERKRGKETTGTLPSTSDQSGGGEGDKTHITHQDQDTSEEFNLNDFISYVKKCEAPSCPPTIPDNTVNSTPIINTDVIEPETKRIKRAWLML